MDWSCTSNGRGPHSQAILVRRTGTRKKDGRTTRAPFQGRGEEGYGGHWSSNRCVGNSDRSAWKTNCTDAPREGEKLLHITVIVIVIVRIGPSPWGFSGPILQCFLRLLGEIGRQLI